MCVCGNYCDVIDHGQMSSGCLCCFYRCITLNSIYMIAATSLSRSLACSLSLYLNVSIFLYKNKLCFPLFFVYITVIIYISICIFHIYIYLYIYLYKLYFSPALLIHRFSILAYCNQCILFSSLSFSLYIRYIRFNGGLGRRRQ